MRVFQHIKASNLLSFGPEGLDLELQDLNVLIGPNGSGKSNFLEIFELLKSLPRNEEDSNNLKEVISKGGGIEEWLFKGMNQLIFDIQVIIKPQLNNTTLLEHKIEVSYNLGGVRYELISYFDEYDSARKPFLEKNISTINLFDSGEKEERDFHGLSVLSGRNRGRYSELIVSTYERIRLYREWSFGRNSIFRVPQRADLRNDRLEQDFSNLGMVLSRLRKDPVTKRKLIAALQDLYAGLSDFEVIVEGSSVQVFFTEGDFSIPATRLSDGSLRYLCLLAILLDPTPPPLICIEEPELGLHPDMMPKLADLLRDAATRTQLVVTTHSDALVDAFSEQPEAILVCEKHEGRTQIKRLSKAELADWLQEYGLGQLWTKGEIGGTRW
jgi:predicted ATPase